MSPPPDSVVTTRTSQDKLETMDETPQSPKLSDTATDNAIPNQPTSNSPPDEAAKASDAKEDNDVTTVPNQPASDSPPEDAAKASDSALDAEAVKPLDSVSDAEAPKTSSDLAPEEASSSQAPVVGDATVAEPSNQPLSDSTPDETLPESASKAEEEKAEEEEEKSAPGADESSLTSSIFEERDKPEAINGETPASSIIENNGVIVESPSSLDAQEETVPEQATITESPEADKKESTGSVDSLNEEAASASNVESLEAGDGEQPSSVDPPTEEPTQASTGENASHEEAETTKEGSPAPIAPPLTPDERDIDIEKLRERLKLVEQRFVDVSTSFKRLQAEKHAADRILKELTPIESIMDVEGLEDHLKNLDLKTQISTEEIKRLNAKIEQHDQRLEELRDIHRLESSSQSDLVERLRKQLVDTEASLKGSEEGLKLLKGEVEQLRSELGKTKGIAKAEEEKGSKAINLLKTVRTKLVKVEKEKEEALKEVNAMREREREEREKERQERAKLEAEVERVKAEKEREVANLRAQFEKELASVKDRHEKESTARKGQFELEAITTKLAQAAYTKDMSTKQSRITSLEATTKALSEEKDSMFDQLQMRQAELESSQSHLESVEARSSELQYQLREAESRVEILTEELNELRIKGVDSSNHASAEELARIISETEGKYELRIAELRQRMRSLEKERQEAEEEWSRNLHGRSQELERLRGLLDSKDREYADSIRLKDAMEEQIAGLQGENKRLKAQKEVEEGVVKGLQRDVQWLKEVETTAKHEKEEILTKLHTVEKAFEDAKVREGTLKASNKTLKDELKKVQSSAALLERQRNPGIGYWSSSSPRTNSFTQSAVDLNQGAKRASLDEPGSPKSTTGSLKNAEEEVNLEYIRNVILQFLEHKEMRPNLVRVLSIILHFTPQETRRLIAKV
ncbi:hypothetical protein M422DRAFT_50052 [Sphaerobolus stellatus SS14]|uniref:GRIP domain-containing protein n=1 Tax=Sphaerobolus stellatus (strain SS14) TaxID=990650 RepID=A0A0C9VL50_SPHS4|nr:hypothetical protein M422DRAFT_50052 [Sphaerobolus stellatus SS14]